MAVALIVYGGAHWAQMESPTVGMRWVFGLAALAILPAIVSAYGHQRLAWLVALPAACVVAVGLVTAPLFCAALTQPIFPGRKLYLKLLHLRRLV